MPTNNATLEQRRSLRQSFEKNGLRAAWLGLYGQQFLKKDPNCFGTLTLKNVVHKDGTEAVPGRVFTGYLIDNFIKSINTPMIVVEEFGKKNGRRHFHFVGVDSPFVLHQVKQWSNRYGFTKIERAVNSLACMAYITKYMVKEVDADTARFWVKWI